ncbi:hypothetical protein CWB89_06805 [Pseudoalteromonas piscicida]|uniref:Uncharacterized protein n=1 Tax=Pseudoalteromonas piscicida TaxID=43662 RepID=A0AAQ2IT00_PSEO7|nr:MULTISPECIES: hypothetical protein [Pseudoalteromonas]KJY91258.1 hypothetical protein TW75_05415 [Pseudoalteromonas piscicida]TMN38089.1 hypothetical protein CWB95_14690 [Pseudoalteromonas piscicida]TMN41132.1 hypothetical protein CWB94_07810 [Pseudoalteromonas piscicida]TMN53225.1 hypothetical protein CWB93_15405 [Pseudoalteromonas piscicida]TMN55646.1 hypothetical protein CWB92_04085 [Pseudoalteromonas piscicida]
MKLSWFFLLLCILSGILLTYIHIEVNNYVNLVVLASIFTLSLFAKGQENIKHLSIILLLVTAVEYYINGWILSMRAQGLEAHLTNAYIFGIHLIVDIFMIVMLKRRVYWSLKYIHKTAPENWRSIYMTHADPILYGIFFGFVLVDLAAFGENLIRYMDLFFGVSEEASKPFWSWGFFYNNYEVLKSILLSCVVTTLLATIFVERQRPDTPDEELESEPK